MNIIYIYRTHFWNEFIEFQFEKLRHDLGPERVFLLHDETNHPPPSHLTFSRPTSPVRSNMIAIHHRDCAALNPLHRSNKDNIESQLMLFKRLCGQEFDFVWIIEYDVYCDGDWRIAFEKITDDESGYLATGISDHDVRIVWNHWFSIYGRRWNKPPLEERVKSFFPLVRISKELIICMEKNIGIYSGFCEVYVPTLARQNRVKYSNIPESVLGDPFDYIIDKNTTIELKNDHRFYHPIVTIPLGQKKIF